MSLTNPNTPVSQQDLQDFYHRILPYLSGSNEGGSGHTIEDAEGTDLTQRDTLQFGEGFSTTDDPTNEKTVVSIDPMPSEDMDSIFDELPTGGNISVTGYVPLGTLISYYGETAPKFFLACDGTAYNKADYPELAKHLLSLTNNTPYIVDGDNTKFKVPDLRGEFIRGTGTNSHSGEGNGAGVGVHQDATEFPAINISSSGSLVFRKSTETIAPTNTDSTVGSSPSYASVTGTAGSNTYHAKYTSRPTNTSVLFCIAYKDIYSNPMNDYSTTEKIVGTWINGKPIYQKTFILPNGIVADTWTTGGLSWSEIEALNINNLILINANSHAMNNFPVNFGGDESHMFYVRGWTLLPNSCVTFQYTKTTD